MISEKTRDSNIPFAASSALENRGINAFALDEVTLTNGLFQELTAVNAEVINSMSADTILYAFRYNANVNYGANFALPGPALGNWAEPGHHYAGHFEGHYMTAAALLYAQNKDQALKEKLIAIIDGLELVQQAMTQEGTGQPIGYLSGFPETRFDILESGTPTKVPWYMIHKVMQGILDVYKYTDYAKALVVVEKLADWTDWRTGRLTDAHMQRVLATDEYGGMQDVLLDLYAVTGKEKYAEMSERFIQREQLIDPLYRGKDNLTSLHGNTYLAKIVGNVQAYNVLGDDYHRIVAENFWNFVIDGRTYITGGNSNGEKFTPPHEISENLEGKTCETCNIYNMLKITRELFRWTGKASYADYYEQAMFNQILGSMDVKNGDKTYYQFMAPNTTKVFNSNTNGNYCCNGTGIESFAKLQDSIYFHTEDEVYVNLFVASALHWREKNFAMEQATTFPVGNKTVLTVTTAPAEEIAINIRVPSWSVDGITVTVNGKPVEAESNSDGYMTIKKAWAVGDVITVSMNMQFDVKPTTDNKNVVAFTYGPIVMAGIGQYEGYGQFYVSDPAASLEGLVQNIRMLKPDSLTAKVTMADGTTVILMPYYLIQNEVHTVYWTLTDKSQAAFKENLALKKPVTADEIYSKDYNAPKAVDGNTQTRWCVKGFTQNHWLMVDLEDVCYLSKILVSWERANDFRFRVHYSVDGKNWFMFADYSQNTAHKQSYMMSGNGYGRYVKLEYISSTQNQWCSVWELAVYGGKIKQVTEPHILSHIGETVELPKTVMAEFADGQCAEVAVNWHDAAKQTYTAEGKYVIEGEIAGTHQALPVTAEVVVRPVVSGGAGKSRTVLRKAVLY